MIDDPTILVPIDVSDLEEPALELVNLLGPLRIVVMGYYPVPDQAAPEQIRDEFEDEAKDALEESVRRFAETGADIESVLVFTRDRTQSVDRIANEYDCDAVLVPGHVESLNHILVSMKDEQNMFRVLEVVALVMQAGDPEVTLYHAESIKKGSAKSELYLRGATDWLAERGLARERITWKEPTAETQQSDLLDLAESHDFVVIGESEPGVRERVLGEMPTRIHDRTAKPVLVVRKER
ncbi:universal stress protein UspA [Halobellus sp. Atlit-31R]|nr:universal stress protein UspA [Halobellus sp. Atlit-31R]